MICKDRDWSAGTLRFVKLWEWGSDERRFLCKDTQFSEQLSTSSRTHETQGGRIDIPRSLGNATSSLHRKHERCSYSRRNCSAVSEQCRGVSPPGAPRWWAPPPAARDREDDHASRAFDDEEIAAPDYPRDDVEIEDQASRAARRPRTPMARSILLVQGKPQLRRM